MFKDSRNGGPHNGFLGRLAPSEFGGLAAFAHDHNSVGDSQQFGQLGADHHNRQALPFEFVDQIVGVEVLVSGWVWVMMALSVRAIGDANDGEK